MTVEREIKVGLKKEEYETIVKGSDNPEKLTVQTNYYFDTKDLLMNKKGITCRTRCKNGIYRSTVKRHTVREFGYSTETDFCERDTFDPNVFAAFGLYCRGNLTTERISVYHDKELNVVADRNTYLGKVDYELEIEYSESGYLRAKEYLRKVYALLLKNGLVSGESDWLLRASTGLSKSERFFLALQNEAQTRL